MNLRMSCATSSGDVGESEVEDDEVWPAPFREVDGLATRRRGEHHHALVLEV